MYAIKISNKYFKRKIPKDECKSNRYGGHFNTSLTQYSDYIGIETTKDPEETFSAGYVGKRVDEIMQLVKYDVIPTQDIILEVIYETPKLSTLFNEVI